MAVPLVQRNSSRELGDSRPRKPRDGRPTGTLGSFARVTRARFARRNNMHGSLLDVCGDCATLCSCAGLDSPWIVGTLPWKIGFFRPSTARELLREAPGPVSAVIPVSPFGAPLDFTPWEKFRDETRCCRRGGCSRGIRFDSCSFNSCCWQAFNATKVLGIGEGGSSSSRPMRGFIEGSRGNGRTVVSGIRVVPTARSFNGKLSLEYAAAVETRCAGHVGQRSTEAISPAWRPPTGGVCQGSKHHHAARVRRTDWILPAVVVTAEKAGADAVAHALAKNTSAHAAGGAAACIAIPHLKISRGAETKHGFSWLIAWLVCPAVRFA